jgi:hypothetical protein
MNFLTQNSVLILAVAKKRVCLSHWLENWGDLIVDPLESAVLLTGYFSPVVIT